MIFKKGIDKIIINIVKFQIAMNQPTRLRLGATDESRLAYTKNSAKSVYISQKVTKSIMIKVFRYFLANPQYQTGITKEIIERTNIITNKFGFIVLYLW